MRFFRTMTGIMSPWESNLERMLNTIVGMCISLSRALVPVGKSGVGTSDKSSVELDEYLRAKHSAILAEEIRNSNCLNKGGIEGLLFLITLLQNRQ